MPNGVPPGGQTGAQTGARVDPYRAYNFKLEILGVTEAHFTECSGMGVRVHPIRYREGGTSQVVHNLPGRVEYEDITLHYGLTQSRSMWDWFMSSVKGKVERKNVSIVLVDNDGVTEVTRWNLIDAWPAYWRGVPLDALSNEAAIESLTLVCETLERA
jgi:phage tail-like protein